MTTTLKEIPVRQWEIDTRFKRSIIEETQNNTSKMCDEEEKVVSITADYKTYAIVILLVLIWVFLTWFFMRDVSIQQAVEWIQRSKYIIWTHQEAIKKEESKIEEYNNILKEKKVQFNP